MNHQAPAAFSIAIASWSGQQAVIRCLESVLSQAPAADVIVALRGEANLANELEHRFPDVRFICGGCDASVFRLRSLAVREVSGSLIAMLEDHSTVCSGWANNLLQAYAAGKMIIGGPIENDPDASAYDWALYFVEYGVYMPPLRGGEAGILSGANIAYDREALLTCRDVWQSVFYETDVNAALVRAGEKLWMLPEARVTSRLRMPLRQAVEHLFTGGVHFGKFRKSQPSRVPAWMWAIATPAIIFVLLFRIIRLTALRQPARLLKIFAGLPPLLILLGAWSAGEARAMHGPWQSKMRFGIDACTWANRRGYGRFTRMLVSTMIAEHPQHEFVLVVDSHTAAEGGLPQGARVEIVETEVQPTEAASAEGSRSLLDLWRMGRAVSRLKLDAFLFPTSYSFFPLFSKTPAVVVFHDAIAEQHAELVFPGRRSRFFWRVKSWLARRTAKRLVTVSRDARAQLATVFRLREADIELVSEGADPCFRPLDLQSDDEAILERYELPRGVSLILYVGGISPHKNLDGLLRAVARLRQAQWHLVLVGDYTGDSFWGCYQEVVDLARSLAIADRVTFTGYVPDADLVLLYNFATMLVLPSVSEGFGLPVVEAMACGLPVAASNRNSLPEIIGDAGLLFDPLDPAGMAEAIQRLLGDEALRGELRAKGLLRAAAFSWKAGAQKMAGILEEVAARG